MYLQGHKVTGAYICSHVIYTRSWYHRPCLYRYLLFLIDCLVYSLIGNFLLDDVGQA